MQVVIAPDAFGSALSADAAAQAIAQGWARTAPGDLLDLCPLSDGGPGFVAVLHRALGGRLLPVAVTGPLGEPRQAEVLLVEPPGGPVTGYLESAQACGLHLVPEGRRDPGRTTTAGLAPLLEAARSAGARRIVVGLGGSATNDGGAGLLAGLGVGSAERLAAGGDRLAGVGPADLAGLAEVRQRWADLELVAATDVDSPLLGFHGASAGYAAQKGATPEQAQQLERALGDLVAAAVAGGVERSLAAAAGAGAAGGLGYALSLLGAQRVPGVEAVLAAVGLRRRLAGAALAITGEGRFDWQSLRGKVVAGVAGEGMATGVPVIVLAGEVEVGHREGRAIGVESAYPVAATAQQVPAALADPASSLAALAERVARTWSRPG